MPRAKQPWKSLPLGAAAFINPTPSAGLVKAGGSAPFLSLADVQGAAGHVIPKATVTVGELPAGCAAFVAGDIVLSKHTPHHEQGSLARVAPDFEGEGLAAPDLHIIRAPEGISANYLFQVLRQPTLRRVLRLSMSGASKKFLVESALKNLFVPLPPLAEQRRIAALLDEVDEIHRIKLELVGALNDLVAATFLELFGDPSGNPKNWEPTLLGDLVERVETGPRIDRLGGSQSSPYRLRAAAGREYGMIRPRAVYTGVFLPEENQAILDAGLVPPDNTLAKGDLLFSPSGIREVVDQITLLESDFPNLVLSPRLWRLRPRPGIPPSFIKGLFAVESVRRQVRNSTDTRSHAYRHIEKRALFSVAVFLPPQPLMRRFDTFYWAAVGTRKREQEAAAKLVQLHASLLWRLLSARPVQVSPAAAEMVAGAEAESAAKSARPFIPPARRIWGKLSGVQRLIWELSQGFEDSFRVEDMGARLQSRHGAHVNREQILNTFDLLVSLGVVIKEGRQDVDRWRRPDPERDQQVAV